MVVEFPKLQGVMGRIYASIEKEPDDIAVAIEEHYRPIQSGGILPETRTGVLLAISDKIDSICGCFSVDMIPTGTSDPYALRRQGIGIIQIILNKGFLFSLKDLIIKNMALFNEKKEGHFFDIVDNVYVFLQGRMTHLLMEEGLAKDAISAVIGASADCVPDVWEKVKALEKRRTSVDFEPIAIAFKRVVNIIKKSADIQSANIKSDKAYDVDEHLFEHASENVLFSSYKDVAKKISKSMNQRDFDKALDDIAKLRDPVDAFFDNVMVMAENEELRINRIALLRDIAGLFGMFADFSKLST
jgi:glycyl-tRNA synthetase beta chain